MCCGADSIGTVVMNPARRNKFRSYPLIRTMLAHTLQTCLLLALPSKAKADRPVIAIKIISWASPPKKGGTNLGVPRSPLCMGRVPLLSPCFQARMLRLDFACSRKTRPSVMFRQPTEKRKNAETSVNLPTWCERIVAPMLKKERCASELSSDGHARRKKETLTVPGKSRVGRGQTANRGPGKSGRRRPSATRSRTRGGRRAER